MRCLILHPNDDVLNTDWRADSWDRVIDFGVIGPETHALWSKALGCTVEPCTTLDMQDCAELRRLFSFGCGQVVDEYGLDWWDLLSLRWLDQFVQVVLLKKVLSVLSEADEIVMNGTGTYRSLIELLAPGRVRLIRTSQKDLRRLKRWSNLTIRQISEILGDKYDGSYRLRRLIAPRPGAARGALVLLPSAYGNASRMAMSYANCLPDVHFLLVATRRSGRVDTAAPNVSCARLASYALGRPKECEQQHLLTRWERLRANFSYEPALALLRDTGSFDSMPLHLCEGLAIRDCWVNVFAREPIAAVLSADEKNPYTRIPLLLAQRQALPTVASHHGALDGRYLFTNVCADRMLVKSQMEWDYVVNVCGVPEEKAFVAAPQKSLGRPPVSTLTRKTIVFFSEPYEAASCRSREVYARVLPPLARLACLHNCELVIKLHPFESLRDRKRLINRTVSSADRGRLHCRTGPLTDELLDRTWFSVTVSSTAAVDSAIRGVPAFLCTWLDRSGFGYAEQFAKFRAAYPLQCADEIADIPKLLKGTCRANAEELWRQVEPDVLRKLLFGEAVGQGNTAEAAVEPLWA